MHVSFRRGVHGTAAARAGIAASARAAMILLCAPITIRPAVLTDANDAEALCRLRPSQDGKSNNPITPTFASRYCTPLLLCTAATPSILIRPAVLTNAADAEALCRIRKPTEYVNEQGSTGFMGAKTELSPEEAQRRRVQARLGTAMRDGAIVLMAADSDSGGAEAPPSEEPEDVIGTVDCVELPAGKGRRAGAPEMPRRFLIRNLWVSPSRRREGIARRLMDAVDTLAAESGITYLSLEVLADNTPALRLYEDLGFVDLEPPPPWLPSFMTSSYFMGKAL